MAKQPIGAEIEKSTNEGKDPKRTNQGRELGPIIVENYGVTQQPIRDRVINISGSDITVCLEQQGIG